MSAIDKEVLDYLHSDLYKETQYPRPLSEPHKAFTNPLGSIFVVISKTGGGWIEDGDGKMVAVTGHMDVYFLEEYLP